jgi:hypothetical protein
MKSEDVKLRSKRLKTGSWTVIAIMCLGAILLTIGLIVVPGLAKKYAAQMPSTQATQAK